MGAPLAFVREIDSAIVESSDIRRASMLRHLTDLFLVDVDEYSKDEIEVIDEVLVRLVAAVEESSRVLLASRLGPATKAPPLVLRILACDNNIDVASPVLSKSEQLDIPTLVECAKTKSQDHLLAISRRKTVPVLVTDILVDRGDSQIVLSVAKNSGAIFSNKGFDILVRRADGDDELAGCVMCRPDLPPRLFEQLVEIASDAVRAKLAVENVYPGTFIRQTVGEVADRIKTKAITQSADFAPALVLMESLNEAGQLSSSKLNTLARVGRFEEVVAALSIMSNTPAHVVETIVKEGHAESVLVLAKAIELPWEATRNIIAAAEKHYEHTSADINECMAAFQRLKPSTARQIFAFHCKQVHAEFRKQ
jgi:uncharacterized protein (DUF2336 family)